MILRRRSSCCAVATALLVSCVSLSCGSRDRRAVPAAGEAPRPDDPVTRILDLSLLVAPELPGVWPVGMQQYALLSGQQIGPGVYNRDTVVIDEHTATQWDAPAHFIPPPGSGLPDAGPTGALTADKVPVWQFVGEACVIDLTDHVDDAADGHSFLITEAMVQDWEKAHRPVGEGDVVVFRSGYSDRYYRELPAGRRFVHEPLGRQSPGWPAPTPECVDYLGRRGVKACAIDSTSMGPLPDLAIATHVAGEKHGIIWTEAATGLGGLPATGAFYALLAPKYAGGSGGEARALAVVEPDLARKLIESARAKRVVDLSVLLDVNHPVTWPGTSVGDEGGTFASIVLHRFGKPRGPYFAMAHILDSQAGTHLVTPSFALPPPGFKNRDYSEEIREALVRFESKHGPRGFSEQTTEKVPLDALSGPAHIVDVTWLSGMARPPSSWASTAAADGKAPAPVSPLITLQMVKDHEARGRKIEAGEVVIFYSGYSDKYFQPFPAGERLFADPLAGKAEGWLAVAPEVLVYLAQRGVRLVGTDGPTLGGVDAEHARQVYWTAGSRGLSLVEFLTNVGKLPRGKFPNDGAYFLFAPIKLKGAHGGYGRAIALY